MAFKNAMRYANNFEDVDGLEGGLEYTQDDPQVLDQIEALEDEVALSEAEGDLDTAINDSEEGEALAEQADTEVEDGEAVLAEADAKAAETGEEAVIPVEDIVSSQEALKTLITATGETIDNVTFGNREALYNDSRATFVQNLEGLREIGKKIKEGLKKIWEKIKKAFKWVVEKIKKVLPTKLNRLRWLLNTIREYSIGTIDSNKLTKAAKEFEKDNKDRFAAAAAVLGPNLEDVSKLGGEMKKNLEMAFKIVDRAIAVSENDGKWAAMFDPLLPIAVRTARATKNGKDALADSITDLNVKNIMLIGISFKGTTIKNTFKVVYEVEDGDTEVKIMSSTVDADSSDFAGIVFSKENALKGLSAVINNSDVLTKYSTRLDEKIEKFAKKAAEDEVSGKFKQWRAKGKIEKAIRKLVMDSISTITSFDSSVLGYALTYGKATLNALKDAKK
jgi:hypothetical protein